MDSASIRSSYLSFFKARGHVVHPSASLVPDDDPTLLFTGAGMNQFKDMFLGRGTLPFRRATTTQKCLRLPDLDNVGRTASHHTFFEMLGNFSFGDYFKAEAIAWADELMREVYGIPRERLAVTVYREDDEAAGLWRKIGFDPGRIWRLGEKDNFWPSEAPSKGPNGPCGPCSEIYFDWGPQAGCTSGPACDPSCSCGRFLEVWNLVFTQFDRRDGGRLEPLPQRNIDTGMGLERMVRVLQGKATNFETDLFAPILARLGQIAGAAYGEDPARDRAMRRIADHVRAAVFAISDGVVPSNERQGYVVRKIVRRALADGLDALGIEGSFLDRLVPAVVGVPGMADSFPELRRHEAKVIEVVGEEERKFADVWSRGRAKLSGEIEELDRAGARTLPGRVAFFLWDTTGFPVDLTRRVLEARGLSLDEEGFETAMDEQRERSRAGSTMKGDIFAAGPLKELKRELPATRFTGYEETARSERLRAMLRDGARARSAGEGDDVALLFEATPFYAEGGGQVGDRGEFAGDGFRVRIGEVARSEGFHVHRGTVMSGTLTVGVEGRLAVDDARHRRPTRRNHTATHLLHWALRRVLGASVQQKGSLVEPARLRFDFSWRGPVPAESLQEVERLVNDAILENVAVETRERPLDEAIAAGAIALFGEKYDERVRVVSVGAGAGGSGSVELCGGTHVTRTGDIGAFKIVSEGGIAAGTRRIEAVTGPEALEWFRRREEILRGLASQLRSTVDELPSRVKALQDEVRSLRKAGEERGRQDSRGAIDALLAARDRIGAFHVFAAVVDLAADPLLALVDEAKTNLEPPSCIVLIGKDADRAPVVVYADAEAQRLGAHAGKLCKLIASELGGGGGGNPGLGRGQGRADRSAAGALEKARAMFTG